MYVWFGVWVCGCVGGAYNEIESSCCSMVMIKVSVHPAGLGPREAGKAWYSSYYITWTQFSNHIGLQCRVVGIHYGSEST